MATFKTSPLIGAIAGPVGGVTFVTSGRGNVVRGCASTVRRSSVRGALASARFASAAAGWLALTDAQRAAWRVRAGTLQEPNALGVPRYLSGWELYSRFVMKCRMQGATVLTTPPAVLVGAGARLVSAYGLSSGSCGFDVAVPGVSSNFVLLVWMATQFHGGNRYVVRRWKFMGVMSSSVAHFSFSASTADRLGSIPGTGVRVALKVENVKSCYWSVPAVGVFGWNQGGFTF